MAFTAVFPPTAVRPGSETTRTFQHKLNPLLSPGIQSFLRIQFSLGDWILIGSFLQSLVIVLSPFRLIWSIAPTILISLYKVLYAVAINYKLVENPHMKDVRVGRHTAIYPNVDGSFDREPGQSIGGSGVCVVLLSVKCNHPLGMLHAPFAGLTNLAKAMFANLEENADEHGFLGYTTYSSHSSVSKNALMQVMYFKSLDHMHKWVHSSESHRAGYDWWNQNTSELDEVSIAHEVYSVPENGFENIYDNAAPFGFAATSHNIQANGGVKHLYQCPIVDANRRDLKMAAARMGSLKNYNEKAIKDTRGYEVKN